jgi:hypothetical protein
MTVPHKNIRWRKSTRSQDQGDCVELGHTGLVRDSKNSTGPALPVSIAALVSAVKTDIITR